MYSFRIYIIMYQSLSGLMHKCYLDVKFLFWIFKNTFIFHNRAAKQILLFKNNSLQIECVVDNSRLLVHLMPMQILTDIEHKLNVVLVHTPNAFSFMLSFGCIWFISKKSLARLEIKTINKNKVSWIVLCLFHYKCINDIPT